MIRVKSRKNGICQDMCDFGFHSYMRVPFYVWHEDPDCEDTPRDIPSNLRKYFASLAEQGVILSDRQKAWYVNMLARRLNDVELMKFEYPSTEEEFIFFGRDYREA